MGPAPRITVIGSGILGASVVFHLARRGARVSLLESRQNPAEEVTAQSFGWVGRGAETPSENPALFALRSRALSDFHRLADDWAGRFQKSCLGAIFWRSTPGATQALIEDHRNHDSPLETLSNTDIAGMVPRLSDPPDCAALAREDFAVEPRDLAVALLTAAKEAGATLGFGQPVTALELRNGRLVAVRTPSARLETDVAVLAAGTGSTTLAEGIGGGLDIDASPAVLLRYSVSEPVVSHILCGPELELRQAADGSLVLAEYYPEDGEAGMAALATETAERLRRHYALDGALSLLSVAAGFRPFPRSGWPITGFLPEVEGVYATVAHPGVVLAPFIGRVAAEEILEQKRDPAWPRLQPG